MQRLQQEHEFRHDRLSGLVIVVLFIIVGLLSAGRVFAANRLVEASDSLRKLDQEVSRLENENQILSEEVREKESVTSIEDQAVRLGFSPVSKYAYLATDKEVAWNTFGAKLLVNEN